MSKDWKIGDRVQYEADDEIVAGTITALVTGQREVTDYNYYPSYQKRPAPQKENYTSHVTVKWDDGEEETLDYWDVHPEDSEMERAFRVKAMEVTDLINEELSQAHKHLAAAEKLAEENGISFSSSISPLSQSYVASTFAEKWPDIEEDFANEITEAYSEYGDGGWEHSAVC